MPTQKVREEGREEEKMKQFIREERQMTQISNTHIHTHTQRVWNFIFEITWNGIKTNYKIQSVS